jgi:hypothetical protein
MAQPPTSTPDCAKHRCTGLPAWLHGFTWSAFILLTLLLVGISRNSQGRNVWEGWRESRELRRPAYAERVYVNEVFRTRSNTWSNLAYVLLGLYGIAIGWHDLRNQSPSGAGSLARTPALSLAFGLACCYLGAGSGLFHASLTRFGQQLDVAAMYAPLLALIAVNIGRWIPCLNFGRRPLNLPTWPILLALVALASSLLFIYKWSMSSLNVLSTLISTVAGLAVLDQFRSTRKLDDRWLVGSCAALVAAVICRQLDIAERFTDPDAWLQGHALWHILTSLSLGCMCFYYRSEESTAPDHAALEKQPDYLES